MTRPTLTTMTMMRRLCASAFAARSAGRHPFVPSPAAQLANTVNIKVEDHVRVGALVDEQHAILIEQPTAPTRLSKARLYTLARVDGEEDVANFGMLGADDDGNNLRASPVNGELLERSIFTVFGAFGLPRLVVRVVCDRVEPMRVAAFAGGEEITRHGLALVQRRSSGFS